MIEETMRIGDKVVITIPQENRKWGYNPCPDGTKATILGFSEVYYGRIRNFGRKPGVYVNRAWVKLLLEDGRKHTEYSGRLELVDKAEYERRVAAFRKYQQEHPHTWLKREFLRELPETPFWEGDFVRVCGRSYREIPFNHGSDVFQIVGIDYPYLNERTQTGGKYPAYNISEKLEAGWDIQASEDNMVLIERGPVWKFYHNEPIKFAGIQEEAQFFDLLGHTEEVRNPANGSYKWTKEEVIEAIQSGLVHGFAVSRGLFGGKPRIVTKRFKDEDLGRRVAKATLEGFGITAT